MYTQTIGRSSSKRRFTANGTGRAYLREQLEFWIRCNLWTRVNVLSNYKFAQLMDKVKSGGATWYISVGLSTTLAISCGLLNVFFINYWDSKSELWSNSLAFDVERTSAQPLSITNYQLLFATVLLRNHTWQTYVLIHNLICYYH